MGQLDEGYINELLQAVCATDREAFYEACKPDIVQGYQAEVNAAWRLRKTHRDTVKRRGHE